MIIAVGGEFLDCRYDEVGFGLIAIDMLGKERVRITLTGWPALTKLEIAAIAWDICAVLIFPRLQLRNAQRRLDDASRVVPTEPVAGDIP